MLLGLGLVLDHGSVAARGRREAALLAATSAASRTNALFEEQLGVRLVVRRLIVNESAACASAADAYPATVADTAVAFIAYRIMGHRVARQPLLGLQRWRLRCYSASALEHLALRVLSALRAAGSKRAWRLDPRRKPLAYGCDISEPWRHTGHRRAVLRPRRQRWQWRLRPLLARAQPDRSPQPDGGGDEKVVLPTFQPPVQRR